VPTALGDGGRPVLEHELPMTLKRHDQNKSSGNIPSTAAPAAETETLLPNSTCVAPARFWNAALAGGDKALTPAEHQHLHDCPRCREHYKRILAAVQVP